MKQLPEVEEREAHKEGYFERHCDLQWRKVVSLRQTCTVLKQAGINILIYT